MEPGGTPGGTQIGTFNLSGSSLSKKKVDVVFKVLPETARLGPVHGLRPG